VKLGSSTDLKQPEDQMTHTPEITSIAKQIEERVGELPDQIRDARAAVKDWGNSAARVVRKHPGLAVVGAFAIGVILARAARRA
jgi:hypothetical protein